MTVQKLKMEGRYSAVSLPFTEYTENTIITERKKEKRIVKYAFSIQWGKKMVIGKFRNFPNSKFAREIMSK